MKVRVKFRKYGIMKFIGHLDVMRYFQKAIRRSGIDIAYTEGMSPHMVMSFAAPLGVGLTSDAEYMDIELKTPVSSAEAIRALNQAGVEGICVTGFYEIPEGKANKAMTLVAAADYTLCFRKGYVPEGDWQSGLSQFFARDEILVWKKTKKSDKEVNIRPMIYEWSANAGTVFMKLASGSAANLKPELVMDAYLRSIGITPKPFSYEINRCEIYADTGNENARRLVPLGDLGKEIL